MSRRIARLLGAVLLLVTAVVVLPAHSAGAVGETTFRNPVIADGADPWLQFHNGNYYLAYTTWSQQMVMRKAPTLAGLATAAPVTIWSDTAAANCCKHWAPEFHRITSVNGTRWYFMYTSGQSSSYDYQHLSVLESAGDDPMGPYTYKSAPLSTNWNIDGGYLQVNGKLYLLWSEFEGSDQSLWIQQMTNPWTVTGSRSLISRPTYDWEIQGLRVNEGPVALQRNGATYLIYSASYCGTQYYKLGMLTLTGSDPLSAAAWTKSPNPVFQSANGVYGPGHNGFFTSPDGTQNWIVYHGNSSASNGCGTTRSTRMQSFTWNADGTPNLGSPVSTSTDLAVPSGERGPITAAVQGAAYQLVNRNSGLCAGVTSGSGADGADVAQYACGATSTNWVLDPAADGYYRLVNKSSNKALDVADCGTADGADVRQWAWLDNYCQEFQVVATSDGWFRLTNRNSGKVLDVASCGTAAGANIQQYAWSNNNCQQWRLQPVGAFAIANMQSGRVADVAGCATAAGTDVRQWEYLNTACQKWSFTHVDNGYYTVVPQHTTGRCLGVTGAATANGGNVTQETCGGTNTQWRLEPLADGSLRFVARHSGLSLDVNGCGLADGANIQQWSWLDNNCQRFHLLPVP